jgi:hypothetical protein
MSEIYRKHGRVARFEDGHTVIVDEAGEAIEIGREFEARPLEDKTPLPEIDAQEVERVAREIHHVVKPHRIERLIVSDGVAEHEFNGVHWTEAIRRIHLSLTHRDFRLLIDRADFDLRDIERIARALGRAQSEREAPPRIRTRPNVSAALLPSLPTIVPPNIDLWQASGGRDGKGKPIREEQLTAPPWSNWYRPSYRVRPVRMPFNIQARCEIKVIDTDVPEAVAILAQVEGVMMRVLIVDGEVSYPATVRVSRIDAVADEVMWYPYDAGALGAEMML